ncbi:MAG: glycosyltransferase family 4 protein [Planctomycetes bacterium]|nr:glycosyltransferase family 4 protein [Planctomycetota bacterium]
MHVLFDARLLHRSTSGLERVQWNLLRELAGSARVTRLRALVEAGTGLAAKLPERVEPLEVATTEDIQAILLDPDPAKRPDLYHLTFFPDRRPRDLLLLALARASVVSVTDAILNRHPEYHRSREEHAFYHRFTCELARHADRILSHSESAGREAVADLGAGAGRVDVALLAVDPAMREPLAPGEVRERLARLGLSGDYFVAVGKDYPHKEHRTALLALAQVKRPVLLACAGERVWRGPVEKGKTLDELARRLGLEGRVRWFARLDDRDVKALMQGSRGLLYPSREEGFGLPPLEAMTLGVPVVAARAMSIPEVCGAGAIYFTPGAAGELKELMEKLLDGGPEVAAQVARGRERAAEFTWKRCLEGTLACYQKACESGRRRGGAPPHDAAAMLCMFEFAAQSPFKDDSDLRAWKERHAELETLFRELEDKYRELQALMPRFSLKRRINKIKKAWRARRGG